MKGELVRELITPWLGKNLIRFPSQLLDAFNMEDIPFVDGCGSDTNFLSIFVPQNIYGIDIRLACIIHDCQYTYGETIHDKVKADVEFLCNLNKIIMYSDGFDNLSRYQKQERFDRAYTYFMFVQIYGHTAFVFKKGVKSREVKELVTKIPDDIKTILEPPNKRGHEEDEML